MARDLFLDNSYHIIGLETDADEKDIDRRGREIEKILAIDEVPSYGTDFSFSSQRRTKARVSMARKRLLDDADQLEDVFFWFDNHSRTDNLAITHCRQGDWRGAIEKWQERLRSNPNDYIALRNKAIAESILYNETKAKKWLSNALKDWLSLIGSDEQWRTFEKIYRIRKPDTDEAVFDRFRRKAKDIITDYFSGRICEFGSDEDSLMILEERTGSRGTRYETDVVKPLKDELEESIKKTGDWLKELESGGALDESFYSRITNLREAIDSEAGSIQNLGGKVWDRSDIKTLRNRCTETINRLCCYLINQDSITNVEGCVLAVNEFLTLAYNIAPSGSVNEKQIEKNLNDLKTTLFLKRHESDFNYVKSCAEKGQFADALRKINFMLTYSDIDDGSIELLQNMKNKTEEAIRLIELRKSMGYSSSVGSSSGSSAGGVLGSILFYFIMGLILYALFSSGACGSK